MTTAITDSATTAVGSGYGQPLTADWTRISFKAKTSAQVTLLTNEGDLVTISGQTSLRASYAMYNRFGQLADETGTSTMAIHASFKQRIHLSVQGDLNEQELADIQRLLSSIKGIFDAAVTGSAEDAQVSAASLGALDDLGSVSALSASLTYSAKLKAVGSLSAVPQAENTGGDTPSESAPDASATAPAASKEPPQESPLAASVIRVKATYRMAQYLAIAQPVTRIPEPTPTTGASDPAASTPAPAISTDQEPTSAAPDSTGAGETTPSATVGVPAPQHATGLGAQTASEIVSAILQAGIATTDLLDAITEFLTELTARVAQEDKAGSWRVRLAEEITYRVVHQLATNHEPTAEYPDQAAPASDAGEQAPLAA